MQENSGTKSGNGNEVPTAKGQRFGVGWLSAMLLGFVLFFFLTNVAATLVPAGVDQPFAFNHRIHVAEAGMECSECHEFVGKETFSGLPGPETCGFCHDTVQEGMSEAERRLVTMLEEGAPLEWNRLFRQPAHVFYSHRAHVEVAKLDCSQCHGDIAERTEPPARVVQLRMSDCIGCHDRENVRAECTSCHR